MKARWIPTITMLTIVLLATNAIEPVALAQTQSDSTPTQLGDRKSVVAVAVAEPRPTSGQQPAATQLVHPKPAPQAKGKSHKWIVIALAAAGAGVATTFALRGKDGPGNQPVSVVVGPPSVDGTQ